jgi:ribonuclease HI
MTTIFTDGSSRGNPGPGGWGAIVISDTNHVDRATVVELGGRSALTTNNRMELMAVIRALHSIRELPQLSEKIEGSIRINSDSAYVINGITKWVHGWVKKNWLTSQKEEVLNRDLWEELMDAVRSVEEKSGTASGTNGSASAKSAKIIWNRIDGHVGIAGNERCDEIATSFADGQPVELFSGRLAEYPLRNVLKNNDASPEKIKSKMTPVKKSRSKAAAYSYVSMVDGVVETQRTWAECEARVKGTRGARYKKALNAAEEAEIIRSWR